MNVDLKVSGKLQGESDVLEGFDVVGRLWNVTLEVNPRQNLNHRDQSQTIGETTFEVRNRSSLHSDDVVNPNGDQLKNG